MNNDLWAKAHYENDIKPTELTETGAGTMTTDTKAVARWNSWGGERDIQESDDGQFVLFKDHERVVKDVWGITREIQIQSDKYWNELRQLRATLEDLNEAQAVGDGTVSGSLLHWHQRALAAELAEQNGDGREPFEAWATSKGLNVVRSTEDIDRYAHTDTFYARQGYQAALASTGKQQVGEVQGDGLAMIGSNLRSILSLCKPDGQGISRTDAANVQNEARHALQLLDAALAACQPRAQVPTNWYPIDQAPKDNKRPLYIAQFNSDGQLIEMDWDASWEAESESWELPQVYYVWMSANGRVEEPTHFAYMEKL